MSIPLTSRPLLALPLMAPLFGCATKPIERQAVLRLPQPQREVVHYAAPQPKREARGPALAAAAKRREPAARPAAPLSPTDKEALFRDFNSYLVRTGQPQ